MRNYAAIVLAAVAALSGCRRTGVEAAKPAETAPVNAAVIRVAGEPFTTAIPVTGTLVSTARVDVKAETTGRVTRFPKEEGQSVAAGEPILWVDEETYALAVRQAESAVSVAQAVLDRTRVLEAHGKTEFERAQNLLKSGGITEKDYKLAQVTEQEAHTQVMLAAAQLEQAKAAMNVASKRLRDTVVRAPVAGEIQKKFVNAGAYLEPPTPVVTLVDNGKLELESLIAASDVGSVHAGQAATFAVSTYPGETFTGRVIEVGPAMDQESRSAKVRIAVAGGGKLKAGMFAEGQVITGIDQQAFVLPASAIYRDERSVKNSTVFVIENGKAARRAIQIGKEMDTRVQVVGGLRPGELVIAEQNIEIADGIKVVPREAGRVSQ